MRHLKREEYVFYQGDKFQVEFYFNDKGKLPAKEYFDTADRQVKIKLLALVKYLAENGRLFDETKFRIVHKKDKICEFKPMDERFFEEWGTLIRIKEWGTLIRMIKVKKGDGPFIFFSGAPPLSAERVGESSPGLSI